MTTATCTKYAIIFTGIMLVIGCTTTVPVNRHAVKCDVSPRLLATNCLAPSSIPESATFEVLIDVMQTDREALRECGLTLAALRDSVAQCNQAIQEFNVQINAVNRGK